MNEEDKDLIRARAKAILPYAQDYLRFRDEADYDVGETFRFITLVLMGPKKFLDRFSSGRLDLDPDAIQEIYWRHHDEIPGPRGLLELERIMIRDHNIEVERLIESQRRPLKVV